MTRSARLALVAAGLLAAGSAAAQVSRKEPAAARGRAFAQANCAGCHAIGLQGASPLADAPPFRTLHRSYPVEDLAESLAEGIVTGHPTMPEFRLDPGRIGDLIAYLKTLGR